MSRFAVTLITVLALGGFASQAHATVVFSGSTSTLSATASFTIEGNQLRILLTNTDAASGPDKPTTPGQVLSGLFFNLGTSTFTPLSASVYTGAPDGAIQPGSIIQTSRCDVQSCSGETNVGGEWSYASGGASWLPGTTHGLSSSGYLNDNTNSANFNGPNLQNPDALNGIEFGLVPNGWAPWGGNGGLDANALIEGTVEFVLEIPDGVQVLETDLGNVYFMYGTSPTDTRIPGTSSTTTSGGGTTGGSVPEPALLSVLGVALAGVALRMRRRVSRT
jgi:hypothetical protein